MTINKYCIITAIYKITRRNMLVDLYITVYPYLQWMCVGLIGYGVASLVLENNTKTCEHVTYTRQQFKNSDKKTYNRYTCDNCGYVWEKKVGRPTKKKL